MNPLAIEPTRTALVLIDLQKGIVGRPIAPRLGPEIVQNSIRLADRLRTLGATIVLVRVAFQPDFKDFLNVPVDTPGGVDPKAFPPDWADIVPEIGPKPGDIVITKRQWGAFYGTEMDLQLRRRDIRTLIVAGISTNIGVESTARSAYEHGYAQIFVEDAMASFSAEAHDFTVKNTFPRIGLVRSTEQVLAALS